MLARSIYRLVVLLSAFWGAFLWAKTAQAAMEFKIDGIENNPAEINYDQSVEVLFSFTGVSPVKTYYLVGAWQKEAGSNYFGYTWNDNWYKYGDDFANFYKVEITESSFSGKLKIKPDIDSTGFKGTGDYQFKIFRHCTSQNSCGDTNFVSLKIIAPPSPSPSPTPTPSPSPSSTPKASPSPTPTPTPSPKASPTPEPSDEPETEEAGTESGEIETNGEVLGENTASESGKGRANWLAITMVTAGLGLLGGAGAIFIRDKKELKSV